MWPPTRCPLSNDRSHRAPLRTDDVERDTPRAGSTYGRERQPPLICAPISQTTSSSRGGVPSATAPRTPHPPARASQAVLQQRLSPARLPLASRSPGPHRRPPRSPRSRRDRAVRAVACASHQSRFRRCAQRIAAAVSPPSAAHLRVPHVCCRSHPPSVRPRQPRRVSDLHRADRATARPTRPAHDRARGIPRAAANAPLRWRRLDATPRPDASDPPPSRALRPDDQTTVATAGRHVTSDQRATTLTSATNRTSRCGDHRTADSPASRTIADATSQPPHLGTARAVRRAGTARSRPQRRSPSPHRHRPHLEELGGGALRSARCARIARAAPRGRGPCRPRPTASTHIRTRRPP